MSTVWRSAVSQDLTRVVSRRPALRLCAISAVFVPIEPRPRRLHGVRKTFSALGYPTYLVPYIAVVKLLGAIAVVSRFSVALSDLAYAGMLYHLLLAVSAHLNASGSPVPALVGLVLLFVSFSTQNPLQRCKTDRSCSPSHRFRSVNASDSGLDWAPSHAQAVPCRATPAQERRHDDDRHHSAPAGLARSWRHAYKGSAMGRRSRSGRGVADCLSRVVHSGLPVLDMATRGRKGWRCHGPVARTLARQRG